MSLGLPPVSVSLKAIAPYLQRAEELVDREPVVAYWAAYYAAQLGISIRAQDANARNLLLNLLDALERLKKEIGPNDAIDIEPASAAYVENFALKVFKMADDEDRAGNASKSTAKKFLAAANFFEVLRVFPKTDVSDSTESKLKYAKWKAVDIAKAFREGRRPTPGPAGSHLDPDAPLPAEQHPPTPPRPSPPPVHPSADIPNEALTPGRWSTTATPGLESTPGSSDSLNNWHEHVVDPLTRAATQAGGSKLRTAWVSTDMEGAASDEEPVEDVTLNRPRKRFSVDVPGASPPPPSFVESSPPRVSELPPGFIPTGVPSYAPPAGSVTFGSPETDPSFVMPPPPPHAVPAFPAPPSVHGTPSAPPVSMMEAPVYPPPREAELTPKLIAKAQKHCRFAISALDYEDAQHAIRELKAALETLGASV